VGLPKEVTALAVYPDPLEVTLSTIVPPTFVVVEVATKLPFATVVAFVFLIGTVTSAKVCYVVVYVSIVTPPSVSNSLETLHPLIQASVLVLAVPVPFAVV